MPFYTVTLTKRGGFTEEECQPFTQYFNKMSHAYVSNEVGDSGGFSHIQGVFEIPIKKTSNVTRQLVKIYEDNEIECVKGISVCVKACTNLGGAVIYTSKEIKDSKSNAQLLVLRGWQSSWIDKKVKENVKCIPHKMLNKIITRVTQGTVGSLMYEYCAANNMAVTCKQDYLDVVKKMGDAGYAFGCIRHTGLYQDVCAAFGSGRASYDVAESELRFL